MNPQPPTPNQDPQEYRPKTVFSEPNQPPVPSLQPQVTYGGVPTPPVAPAAPGEVQSTDPTQPNPPASSKKVLIIVGIVIGVAILFAMVSVVLVSSKKSKSKKNATTTETQPAILLPAKDIEIEQINNSLKQDMSSFDDDRDYPANSLDDKTLGL